MQVSSYPTASPLTLQTPEIGRRVQSHTGSAAGIGSQRSSFLPWDHGVGGTGFSSDFDFGGFAQGDIGDLQLGGQGENIGYGPLLDYAGIYGDHRVLKYPTKISLGTLGTKERKLA